ncbi:unnamed protein product [Arctia plantaginis]|uniref:Uncharacterized protein n=1 Tax=Arctia plantaginis TaxID=874455 RepID=A0A8S1BGD4_ARCPL|nr:unnamed protein product [Arctia plantaginis]
MQESHVPSVTNKLFIEEQYTQKKEMPLQRSPSTGMCSSQPNLSTNDDGEANVRINTRKRKMSENKKFAEFCSDMKVIFQEFQSKQDTKYDNLVKAIEALTIQNEKLIESNGEIEKILQQNIDQQNELQKKVFGLEVECANAHNKIDLLEEQLDQLQRNQLRNVLEVRNVPREEKEDLNKIVTKLMRTVDSEANMEHVRQVYRAGKANAPIVIEFKNFNHKIQLLKSLSLRHEAFILTLKFPSNSISHLNVSGTEFYESYVHELRAVLSSGFRLCLCIRFGIIPNVR